jgi:CheY-like chemotaxis protein
VTRELVLVVDDNPINLKVVQLTLESAGFDVHTAVDSEHALAAIAAFHPRLVLMDLQLPGMDGLELTRRLKANPNGSPIIIAVTAYAMKGDEQHALSAGCDLYLTKPIDTRTLAATVAECLAR